MPVAFWCILAAVALAYLPVGLAKASPSSQYDNANPRASEAKFSGLAARAYGAHLNGFEAFPLFAAAVITAHMLDGPSGVLDMLAIAWVVARAAYVALYVGNVPKLRTPVWGVGFALAIAIFTLPAWG